MAPDRVISHAEVYPDTLERREPHPPTPFPSLRMNIYLGEVALLGCGAEWKMVVNYLYSIPSFPLGLLHLWLIWSMSLFSLAFIYGTFRAGLSKVLGGAPVGTITSFQPGAFLHVFCQTGATFTRRLSDWFACFRPSIALEMNVCQMLRLFVGLFLLQSSNNLLGGDINASATLLPKMTRCNGLFRAGERTQCHLGSD